MTITILQRYSGDAAAILKVSRINGPILLKNGAVLAQLTRINSGPHTGQHMVIVQYPDWEGYGTTQKAVAQNAAFQKALGVLAKDAKLEERTYLVGIAL